VAEYLLGEMSYRSLGRKYGVDFRTLHSWVSNYRGESVSKKKEKSVNQGSSELPTDIKELQEELRKANLKNKLLDAMIDIAEDELKISIRKKSGARR